MRCFSFFFSFFLFSSFAFAGESLKSLEGHAIVEWSAKKRTYRFDQAIVIENRDTARFETLDDFGNTVLRLDFVEEGGKKIISMPLSRSELIHYLLYQIPPGIDDLLLQYDDQGRMISVETKEKRKKENYKIHFLDLKKRDKIVYPNTIEMIFSKARLKISWQSVKFSM